MFDPKISIPKRDRPLLVAPQSERPKTSRQHRLMVGALALLLVALASLVYSDRDFWFPETEVADEVPTQPEPAALASAPSAKSPARSSLSVVKPKAHGRSAAKLRPADPGPPAEDPPPAVVTNRTVLAPLEIEVVAGDVHRTVQPGTNSVRVELQPGSPPQSVAAPPNLATAADTAAGVTNNAAERIQMSADTSEVVSRSVRPDYPMLARQMKVQGSVILQALIGRDGMIQDLRVLSGPPILANAAEEAVKQWHFRPHYQGVNAVETQAKITVNFTISTN